MPKGTCKLCLQFGELKRSHFMPASLYKQSRRTGEANPNPLLLTETRKVQTSEQMTDYVFCGECE